MALTAGKKAALTRKRRAAGRKAAATRRARRQARLDSSVKRRVTSRHKFPSNLESENTNYREALRAFRKKLILDRLRQHGNSAFEAAASLKISRATFFRYWTDAKRFP
jgi:transcriptional regulator with PAS, ATPase and Fis domain